MKRLLLLSFVIIGLQCHAQSMKMDAYKILGELVGGVWTYEGRWPNGEPFKQEKEFSWGLDKNIIKVNTKGIVNQETRAYGLRNEGIRTWDVSVGKMKFYEFDVFGGVTEGYCIFEEDVFHYEYEYEMEGKIEIFRDSWRKIDNNTYQFSVNMKTDKSWTTYTTNEYRRKL